MSKSWKKYFAIVFISLMLGCGIGTTIGHSGPQDPTWDENLGLYNVQWFNASVGVSTPYLEVDEISLGGDKRDTWSEGGRNTTGGYQYLVYKDDTTYYAEYPNGTIAFSETNAYVVMQSCVDALYSTGGNIFVSPETFDFGANSLTINGGGRDKNAGRIIGIKGSGLFATAFTTDDGVDAFVLANASRVHFADFKVVVTNANCIFGDGTNEGSYPFDTCEQDSFFERLYLRVGSASTSGWGMYLQNSDMGTISQLYVQSWGDGACKIEALADAHYSYGNMDFDGQTVLLSYRDNGVCLALIGHGTSVVEDVVSSGRLYVGGGVSATGETGILMNSTRHCKFPDIKSEYVGILVRIMGGAVFNEVGMPHYNMLDDGGTYVSIEDTSHLNIVEKVFVRYIGAEEVNHVFNDSQTDPRMANTFRDVRIDPYQVGTLTFSLSPVSRCENWVVSNSYTEQKATKTAVYQFTATDGGNISTTSPTGIKIDASGEKAIAWGTLPDGLHKVIEVEIWAIALANTSAVVGEQMHLEIVFYAGGSGESYNDTSHSWSKSYWNTLEVDYDKWDVIHWRLRDTSGINNLINLGSSDCFEIFAIYESTGGTDDDITNAVIRTFVIVYE